MSMFIGRLINTKFIKISWAIAASLYTYAGVRTLYSFLFINDVFRGELESTTLIPLFDLISDWMYHASFILKIVLFLSISWLIDTGRLLYYIVNESSLFFKGEEGLTDFLLNYDIEKNKTATNIA